MPQGTKSKLVLDSRLAIRDFFLTVLCPCSMCCFGSAEVKIRFDAKKEVIFRLQV